MTASSARCSMAISASLAAFVCAVTAATWNRSGARRMISSVLVPTEPVAPSIVTAFTWLQPSKNVINLPPKHQALAFRILDGSGAQEESTGRRVGVDQERYDRRGESCEHNAVHTVQEATMARNERARVLDATTALDGRLGEIPDLRHQSQQESKKRQPNVRAVLDEERKKCSHDGSSS